MGMSLSADEACSEQVKDEHVLLRTASSEAARGDMTTSICLHETQGKSASRSRHQALPGAARVVPVPWAALALLLGGLRAAVCKQLLTQHPPALCPTASPTSDTR